MQTTIIFYSSSTLCDCTVCKLTTRNRSTLSSKEISEIHSKGRPTPELIHLTKQTKTYVRHFQTENYTKCEWLTGCSNKSLLYCWPCLLFSTDKTMWNGTGFSDLNNLQKLIKRHSYTKTHIRAIIKEKTFGKANIVDVQNEDLGMSHEQHNKEVQKNREILKRLIDVVCFLGEHELDFQNHSESENSLYKRNYVDLLNSLTKYNSDNSTQFKGDSDLIQNDIALSIEEVILKKIKSEIENTSFVAIILNEAPNVNIGQSQLSKIIRYMTSKGELKERFLGFVSVPLERTSATIYDMIRTMTDELNCGSKLVSQSYDGAVVMPRELSELQARVKEIYPSALFVHCMEHSLSLVLQQSLNILDKCKTFFSTLNGLAAFFSKSSKRADGLDLKVKKKFPKASTIKWYDNDSLVKTVHKYWKQLIEFFHQVLDNQGLWDNETIICSRRYIDLFETDTDFNFLLLVFSEIFQSSDKLFAVLEKKTGDINFCIKNIQEFKSLDSSKSERFNILWDTFLQSEINVQPQKKRTRVDIMEEPMDVKYRKLYFEIVSNILFHIESRFNNLSNLRFLELANFNECTCVTDRAFDPLKRNYCNCFDFQSLKSELSVIYNTSANINKKSPLDLWKSLEECGLDQACSEIRKLCELTMTIPFTSVPSDPKVSALNRVKQFLRNTMGQERLPALALLSIERELVHEISRSQTFYGDVIDEFAKRNKTLLLNFK